MSSYSRRFLGYHQYIASMSEDILAISLCFPFTGALYLWNNITDLASQLPFLPEGTDLKLWKIGRVILLAPLHTLNGILALTLVPLIAAICALNTQDPPIYRFSLGAGFQRLLRSLTFRTVIDWLVPSPYTWFPLLSLALQLTGLLGGFPTLFALGSIIWSADCAFALMGLAFPALQLLWFIHLTYSVPALLALGVAYTLSAIEGQWHRLSEKCAQGIHACISAIQFGLLRLGINSFKNAEEIAGEPINEIPSEDLFISESNHAFSLENLERNLARGLQNYYLPNSDRFEAEDVVRLARHPRLPAFPQLNTFVQEEAHRAEFTQQGAQRTRALLSERGLGLLDTLGKKMRAPDNGEQFMNELAQANDNFDQFLTELSPDDRRDIETVNVLGGTDPDYQLRNYLNHIFGRGERQGGWCKHDGGSNIREMVARLRTDSVEEGISPVFWRREYPTHWVVRVGMGGR